MVDSPNTSARTRASAYEQVSDSRSSSASLPPRRTLAAVLHAHAFLPVLVLSGAACLAVETRWRLTHNSRFGFLYWNLGLALVPYLCSLGASLIDAFGLGRWWNLLPLGALAFVFLPNAPYLVTDLIHLGARNGVPFVLDAAIFFLFGAAGWLMGLAVLHAWRTAIEVRLGPNLAWAWVVAAAFASGFGIYLGRVSRWNSWDVARSPGPLLEQIARQMSSPAQHPEMVWLTSIFGALLVATYMAFERCLRGPSSRWRHPRSPTS